MADSKSFIGARPLLMISAASGESFQSSLVIWTLPEWSNNVSVGLASGVGTPLAASDGPIPRITTFFAMSPVMIKPAIDTRSPVSTKTRVEMFCAREGDGGGFVIVSKAVFARRKCPAVVGCLSSQKTYWSGLPSESWHGLVMLVN